MLSPSIQTSQCSEVSWMKQAPEARGSLSILLNQLSVACKFVESSVRKVSIFPLHQLFSPTSTPPPARTVWARHCIFAVRWKQGRCACANRPLWSLHEYSFARCTIPTLPIRVQQFDEDIYRLYRPAWLCIHIRSECWCLVLQQLKKLEDRSLCRLDLKLAGCVWMALNLTFLRKSRFHSDVIKIWPCCLQCEGILQQDILV